MMENIKGSLPCPDARPPPGTRPGCVAQLRAPGGQAFGHGLQLGGAWRGDVGPPSRGFTTCRKGQRSRVKSFLGGSRRQGSWRSQAAEASSMDLECHLFDGEGVGDGARGWENLTRYNRPGFDASHGLQNLFSWEKVDSLPLWSCRQWEAAGRGVDSSTMTQGSRATLSPTGAMFRASIVETADQSCGRNVVMACHCGSTCW